MMPYTQTLILKYAAWFRAEVAKGLKDLEDGKVISQEEAERILDQI